MLACTCAQTAARNFREGKKVLDKAKQKVTKEWSSKREEAMEALDASADEYAAMVNLLAETQT